MHRPPPSAPSRGKRGRSWRPVHSPLSPFTLPCAALAALASTALAAPPRQADAPPPLFVSTTADLITSASLVVEDGDVVRVESGSEPRLQLGAGHWLAAGGLRPGDIDALARRPGYLPGHHGSLLFSLLSNEAGVQDGDVLALASGGGLEVVVSEGELLAGLGLVSAPFDLDALAVDDQGRVLFSVQALLLATALGDVADGDVLRLEHDGSVTRVMTAAVVQACFEVAAGTTSPIGDVQGLEWVAGELWVVPQGPSSHDGGVFSCGTSPIVQLDEAGLGLDGAELNALALVGAGADLGRLVLTPQNAVPGQEIQYDFRGGAPGHVLALLAGGYAGYVGISWLPGFGAVYLDPADPWIGAMVSGMGPPLLTLDSSGAAAGSFWLPLAALGGPGPAGAGWTFQFFDPLTLELAAPFRIGL